jgi:hypothetical protein
LGNIIDVSILILGGVSKVGQVVKAMINLLLQGNFVNEVSPTIVFTISFIGKHVVLIHVSLTPCQLAQLFERLHNPKQCHSQLKVNP